MPITQERMLALIDAGLDYQQATKQACQYITQALSNVHYGNDPAKELEDLALLIVEGGLLRAPTESPVVLQIERRHFKKFAVKNARRKQDLRSMRATNSNLIPRNTAPETFEDISSVRKERSRSEKLTEAMNQGRKPQFHFRRVEQNERANIDREVERDIELSARQAEFLAKNPIQRIDEKTGSFAESPEKPKLVRDPKSGKMVELAQNSTKRTEGELDSELDDFMSGGIGNMSKDE